MKGLMIQQLPKEYIENISNLNSGSLADTIHFYEVDEIDERNIVLETEKYASDYIAFADDNGDTVFLFERDGSSNIYQADMGDISAPRKVAQSLSDFCLLFEEDEVEDKGEFCQIIWKKNAGVDMKALLMIKKKFELSYTAKEILGISKNLPCVIKDNIRVCVAKKYIASLGEYSNMFEIKND